MKLTTKELVLIPLFSALMIVGAMLKIPNPLFPAVPLTFQLFFCIFAGLLLGARNGLLSQLIYLLLGLVGLPVFSGGGGLGYVLKPTFGYLIGFALAAFIVGFIVERLKSSKFVVVFGASSVGYAIAYLVGNLYFYLIFNLYLDKAMSLQAVFTMMFPYMIKDLILMSIAAYASTILIPTLKRAGYHSVSA